MMMKKNIKEARKSRPIRMTDAEWSDAMLVGAQKIRLFVTKQAEKIKKLNLHES